VPAWDPSARSGIAGSSAGRAPFRSSFGALVDPADGRFEITGVPPGDWRLVVVGLAPDLTALAFGRSTVTIAADETPPLPVVVDLREPVVRVTGDTRTVDVTVGPTTAPGDG